MKKLRFKVTRVENFKKLTYYFTNSKISSKKAGKEKIKK